MADLDACVATDWELALADAELAAERCVLVVGRSSTDGSGVEFLKPGTDVWADDTLSEDDVDVLERAEHRDLHRVILTTRADRAGRLALLRSALQYARQFDHDPRVFDLSLFVTHALSRVYSECGPGSASIMGLHPAMTDAAAVAAAFVRRHEREFSDEQLWGPQGAILRTTAKPLVDQRLLGVHVVVWAALHRDAVEEHADRAGGMDAYLQAAYPEGVEAWRRLVEDVDFARIARAANLSIPSKTKIAAAGRFPALAWDRTLDLLDRGLELGQALLGRPHGPSGSTSMA